MELTKKLEELSQPSKTETKTIVEEAEVVDETEIKEMPKPKEEMVKAEEVVNLSPEEVAMFKRMVAGGLPKEEKVEEAPAEPEPTEEELQAMHQQRLEQLNQEITRLQNTGIFRTEVLYQLVSLNSNLERIALALESESEEDEDGKEE